MSKLLLFTCALMLGACMASAQIHNGSIAIFADNSTFNPSYCLSATPGPLYVYFLHINSHGAIGSQWAAPAPPCLSAVHVADLPVFAVTIGNTASGVIISYATCKTGWFHIMTVLYEVASVGTCCHWSVIPDPSLPSGRIEIPDCDYNMTYGTGGQGIFDTNPTCCSTPTDETTWGKVKAVYGN